MSETPVSSTGSGGPPLLRHLDPICDQFEAAWRAADSGGTPPRLEDYLQFAAEPEHDILVRELIAVDAAYRRLRGETPHADDYHARFPRLELAVLNQALASMPWASRDQPPPGTNPFHVRTLLGRGEAESLSRLASPAEPEEGLVGRAAAEARVAEQRRKRRWQLAAVVAALLGMLLNLVGYGQLRQEKRRPTRRCNN
jgi:hypothetical protein